MIMSVAEALPRMVTDEERERRAVYPDLANIRMISAHMAVEVIKAAEGEGRLGDRARSRLALGDAKLLKWVQKHMYYPAYKSVVYLPVGVNE
jgi:malate dehydrogenase (oxaloacetate-decarboxylating)(NADP+)